jgi:hypothetical protein
MNKILIIFKKKKKKDLEVIINIIKSQKKEFAIN